MDPVINSFVAALVLVGVVVGINETTIWTWTCKRCNKRFEGTFLEFLSPFCSTSCYKREK